MSLASFLIVELNKPFDWFKRSYNAHAVFAPCRHHKQNSVLRGGAEVEVAFLSLDDLHAQVDRIAKDNFLCLGRLNVVEGDMARVRLVPVEFQFRSIHISPLSVPLL